MSLIKMSLYDVAGYEPAIRSMRAAMKSYDKSDTTNEGIGPVDKALVEKLILGGPEHSKCIRQIIAWFELTTSRYVFQEFDTYRIGVEKGSESTMHMIASRLLEYTDFEEDAIHSETLVYLNELIMIYRETRDIKDFLKLKRALPEGFLQIRHICASYQALRNMYSQRRKHKLPQWREFCEILEKFPESWIITTGIKD